MSNQSTTLKAIADLGKSLREVNNCPVLPSEKITKIKRIVGKDGNQRELITVENLETRPPAPGERQPRGDGTFYLHYDTTYRTLIYTLRKGFGCGRGIVTDGKFFRYVK